MNKINFNLCISLITTYKSLDLIGLNISDVIKIIYLKYIKLNFYYFSGKTIAYDALRSFCQE